MSDATPSMNRATTEGYARQARQHVENACQIGRFIVICLDVSNDRLHCHFDAGNFPAEDLAAAERMVVQEFRKHGGLASDG